MLLDAHVHVGIRRQIWGIKKNTAEMQIAKMDELGIDKAFIFSPASGLAKPEDFREGNDFVAEAMARYPERLLAFAIVTPMHFEQAVEELDRCLGELGFWGIKLQPTGHGFYPIDSPLLDPIIEKGIQYDVPILIHTDFNSKIATPYQLAALAKRFPEAKIIMAHMGMDPDLIHFVPGIVRDLPNVYCEISCTPDLPGAVVKLPVTTLGASRVIFGSDAPTVSPELALLKVKLAGLAPEEEQTVLGQAAWNLVARRAQILSGRR